MRARGLNPMAVYHIGEDISWLFRMLDLGCDYIGLGALSMRGSDRADAFYSYVWSHLVNRDGRPIVKVHGLGEARRSRLMRYPWYSADSTSWIYAAQRTGQLVLPSGRAISIRNDGKGSNASPSLIFMDKEERAEFDWVLEESGVTSDVFDVGGKNSWLLRAYVSAWYYKYLQWEVRDEHPIKFKPQGFLSMPYSNSESINEQFHMHLVCSEANISAFPIIAKLKHRGVLLSYYYLSLPPTAKAAIKRGTRKFDTNQLKQFVHDPIEFVASTEPWLECWNILEKYVK
jgi:hypothetical protein